MSGSIADRRVISYMERMVEIITNKGWGRLKQFVALVSVGLMIGQI